MTLASIEAALRDAGIDEARAEALILASRFTGRTRASLLASPQDALDGEGCDGDALSDAVARRTRREPLTYITGRAYFMNEEYEVSPAVLSPRRETETLVEAAASAAGDRAADVLDVCTGSGCVAISLAALAPRARVHAIDVSPDAVAIAARNAERNGVAGRVEFEAADMFSWTTDGRFDVIASNPPYIRADEMASLDPELSFEPRIALTDGGDGLSFVRELCSRYARFLAPGGVLLVEIGAAQGDEALAIARSAGLDAAIMRDLSRRDRVLEARRKEYVL